MTNYFKMNEFLHSETADKLGIENKFEDDISDLRIKELVHNVLQPLREALGPVTINSGYRSPELNKVVGGAKNSHHMLGSCADITLGSVALNKLAFQWIRNNCEFRQLIWEKGGKWIHIEYLKGDNKKQILNID